MKKILSMMGIALLMASCTDDYTDWASPLSNPQESPKTVTLAVEGAADIDYANLTTETVQLFVPTLTSDLPGVTSYEVQVEGASTDPMIANTKGFVNAEELRMAVESIYGKRPDKHTLKVLISALTLINGVSFANVGECQTNVTLKAPKISQNYCWTHPPFYHHP